MSKNNKARKILTKNVQEVAQALVSLSIPGKVITDDLSSAYTQVGEGNILRVEVAADTYVAFDTQTGGAAVDGTTSPALKLTAGIHYVVCAHDFVRMSANPTRVELLEL